MKLKDVYKIVIETGIKMDPRGRAKISNELKRVKKQFEKLPDKEKAYFDRERLRHPYADTRILYGEGDKEVRAILAGIDIEVGEVLLADALNRNGKKIDLLLSHHPEGMALAGFYNVMYMQIDILDKLGVPVSVAESLMLDRIREVERRVSPANHTRSVDAARLLGTAFMTCHTPADNCVVNFLQNTINRNKPDTLGDILEVLMDIPEYKEAALNNTPPKIIQGSPSSKAGRVFVDMTGGTEGAKNIFSRLSQAGVSTLVCMHLSEEHFKKAKEEHLNVIIAGHIASDNIGLNIMLDEIEKKGDVEVVECSGFKRFHRSKKK